MTDDRKEALAQLASRVEDMQAFLDMECLEGDDELGSVYDYGLEWSKDTTDHRNGTVTYVHVISTGGPHEEFQVTFGFNQGGASVDVDGVTFVSMPWFGREEITVEDTNVTDFYNQFFGDLVEEEMSKSFNDSQRNVYDYVYGDR